PAGAYAPRSPYILQEKFVGQIASDRATLLLAAGAPLRARAAGEDLNNGPTVTNHFVNPSGERPSAGTSLTLLDWVRKQDPAAWRRLVNLYSPLVMNWCRRRYGLQSADAEDVGQEVFRAVAEKIRDFRRDRPGDSFRAWLRRITHSKAIDELRK